VRSLALAIVRCYPRAWQERYFDEMEELLARRRVSPRDLVDLLAGAVDARLRPQRIGTLQLALASPGPMPPVDHPPAHAFGVVRPIGAGVVSRRTFMRRMLSAGVGILSLEFLGGTLAFLWPPPAEGVGVEHRVGTLQEIAGLWPRWAEGRPYEFRPARAFLINVPAAKAMALGERPEATARTATDLLALWRKCPHLGCMVPAACEERGRFQCLCHQSTYNILGEKLKLGPAPRGMDRFPVRIDDDGTVIIDTREIVKGPPTGTVTFHDAYPFDQGCR
jgi:Rieske Fe-S protein